MRYKIFYGWYIVVACWIMVFLISAVPVSVFFKPMLEDFGWDRATLSLVQFVALIVFVFASPFLGQVIDRFGPKFMISICVLTQTLSSAINGIATSIWRLYLARFFYEVRVFPATGLWPLEHRFATSDSIVLLIHDFLDSSFKVRCK